MPWASFRLSGYAPDLPPDAVPAEYWTTLSDVVTRDGVAERFIGAGTSSVTGTFLTRPQWAAPVRTPPGAFGNLDGLVYAGNNFASPSRVQIAYYVETVGHGLLTPAAWAGLVQSELNAWTGGPLSGGVIVNGYGLPPLWAPNTTAAVTLLSATLLFAAMRPYKYMAIGISDLFTANSLNTIRWSASAVPGAAPTTWAPAAGNDAGSVDLTSSGVGRPVDGGALGEDFIIYGENNIWLMTYVGGATVMAIRRISSDTGIAFRNCWAEVPGGHIVLTKDDVVLVNQTGIVKSLVSGRLRRKIFEGNLMGGDTRQQLCQVWSDRRRGRIYVMRPSTQGTDQTLDLGYCYELASDSWSRITFPSFLSAPTDQFVGAVTANLGTGTPPQPNLYILDQGATALGECAVRAMETTSASHPATLMQKDDLDLGDASRVKVVRGVRVRATSSSAVTVKVTVGSKYAADEAYTYGSTETCVLGSNQFVPALSAGRWFSVKIESNAAGDAAFRCHGFDLEYTERGAW
jgi:hypothetical protein